MAEQHTIDCPECGDSHRILDSFPSGELTISTVDQLHESDSVELARPTMMLYGGASECDEMTTPMVVIQKDMVQVVSWLPELEVWAVTYEVEPPENHSDDPPFGSIITQMASECSQAGHRCPEAWMPDGEPQLERD